jgi:integrase
MERVPRPKWAASEKLYWTLDEYSRFIAAASDSPLRYAPLFLLLATTGLRMSEALAFEAADLEQGTVTVRGGQVWDRKTGYVAGDTKSVASRRMIPVPALGRAALAAIPFRTQGGLIPRPPPLYATLATLCTEAEVPAVSPHGLRHIHAALAYRATGDVYAVQARLGHKNVTTTMGIYGFGMRADDTTREALDALLASTTPPAPAPGASTGPASRGASGETPPPPPPTRRSGRSPRGRRVGAT